MKEIAKFVLVAAFFLAGMRLVIAAGEQGAAMGKMMTNQAMGDPTMMANMMMNKMMGNIMGNQVMNQVTPDPKQMINEMKGNEVMGNQVMNQVTPDPKEMIKDTMMPEGKAKDSGY